VNRPALLPQQQGAVEELRESNTRIFLNDNAAITASKARRGSLDERTLTVTLQTPRRTDVSFDRRLIGQRRARPAENTPFRAAPKLPISPSTSALELDHIPRAPFSS